MSSRLDKVTLALQFTSASIVRADERERIVFPAIVFGEAEVPPTRNLSQDPRFEITSVEVQRLPADEARRGTLGYATDLDETDPKAPGPIRTGLSLSLPAENFDELADLVTRIKAKPIELQVVVDANEEVEAVAINGVPVRVAVKSDYKGIAPAEPSSALG